MQGTHLACFVLGEQKNAPNVFNIRRAKKRKESTKYSSRREKKKGHIPAKLHRAKRQKETLRWEKGQSRYRYSYFPMDRYMRSALSPLQKKKSSRFDKPPASSSPCQMDSARHCNP